MSTSGQIDQQLKHFRDDFETLRREIGRVIVGQEGVVEGLLTAMVAGGHVLLEGLPGLGKTRLVRALAAAVDLSFQRIQCTPDLMPADVIGTYVIMETPQGRRTFEFQKGPLFANLVLADQVNRTMPKTQAALLEAMDEESITVSTESFRLPRPYLVVATQNPLEMEGTYPLPEAQIDRFLFKLVVQRPSPEQMEEILQRTTEAEQIRPRVVVDGPRILEMGELIRMVPVADEIRRWAVSLVSATHPDSEAAPEVVRQYVRYGSSPRGAQAMMLGAKARAVLEGRYHVSCEDLRAVAPWALRHRLILNFRGQADEGLRPDAILAAVLESVPEPAAAGAPP
jgi:MoxR-like ATPase